ncbi:MAG TPA: hypothetical protein VEH84_10655 [Alphaproteobacteria bacterium]|nr:hypothetical protein [Alphaproteobacteria bacterium]
MKKLAILAFSLGAVAAPSLASAQEMAPMCQKRTMIVDQLSGRFSEQPKAVGVTSNGGIVELLSSQDGSTWTLLVTMPDGISCLLAAGVDWIDSPQLAMGPKA